jgi:DNA-binding transcriptional MerR regulator
MDLLDLEATAKALGLPVETVRGYASRFVLVVPAVRAGARLLYPADGVKLLGEIHQAVDAGAQLDEIEASLQEHFPVTVISPGNQPPTAPSTSGSPDLTPILSLLSAMPTADQINELRDETAQLRMLMAERDARQEIVKDIIEAEIRSLTQELRNEIASLRYELQSKMNGTAPLVVSPEPVVSTNGHHHPESDDESVKERNGRVPRRMGQPLRPQTGSN